MATVNHIGERADTLPRVALEPHRAHHLTIDRRDLLARAQIGDGLGAIHFADAERDTAAGAAAIKSEHKTGLFRGAAMHERIYAQCAMFADQPRRDLFDERKSRPPHQRTVAEHPEFAPG